MTKKQCARREHNKLLVQMGLMGLIQVKLSNIALKSGQPVMPVEAMPGICRSKLVGHILKEIRADALYSKRQLLSRVTHSNTVVTISSHCMPFAQRIFREN